MSLLQTVRRGTIPRAQRVVLYGVESVGKTTLAAEALKEKAGAYPELLIWMPNLIFQALGFWLIYKVNRHPM
jgi:lipopolysaccharide export LptBFGC system permease protein LptF